MRPLTMSPQERFSEDAVLNPGDKFSYGFFSMAFGQLSIEPGQEQICGGNEGCVYKHPIGPPHLILVQSQMPFGVPEEILNLKTVQIIFQNLLRRLIQLITHQKSRTAQTFLPFRFFPFVFSRFRTKKTFPIFGISTAKPKTQKVRPRTSTRLYSESFTRLAGRESLVLCPCR